jgi:hypothetical protein
VWRSASLAERAAPPGNNEWAKHEKEIQMEEIKREDAPNEDINLQADALTDLPVTVEQADETKGGGMPRIKTFTCPSDPYIS